jgi:hypothetical protein
MTRSRTSANSLDLFCVSPVHKDRRDCTYTTSAGKTSDRRLCNTLDVVTKNLSVALCSSLAKALATFSACEDASVKCFDAGKTRSKATKSKTRTTMERILTSSHDD